MPFESVITLKKEYGLEYLVLVTDKLVWEQL